MPTRARPVIRIRRPSRPARMDPPAHNPRTPTPGHARNRGSSRIGEEPASQGWSEIRTACSRSSRAFGILSAYFSGRAGDLTWDDRWVTRLVNRGRSLEELERDRWSARWGGETRLMATVRELRRKPIGGPSVEDMRLLIGQDVGLARLLPLAMEVLRADPLAEATCTRAIYWPPSSPGTSRSGPSSPNSGGR
ncbi:contact-dependent growth inhibition system immunity protein [Streptomyces sp. NPDC059917]|uniref:contact-dependent growth inhibition system immunity protein n=1 Tax=Streptomyces sp. NPDC059917 TaxID=3347002 RepID=UPI00365C93C1